MSKAEREAVFRMLEEFAPTLHHIPEIGVFVKIGAQIDMDRFVGKLALFFGVDNQMFKLNNNVFEAIENPEDGYRSCLDKVVVADPKKFRAIFPVRPLDRIRMSKIENTAEVIWELASTKDSYVWLRIGTNYNDDYYPYFVFEYNPRPPGSYRFRWPPGSKREWYRIIR